MSAVIEVKYFNSFILRKTINVSNQPVWNGSNGIPQAIGGYNRGNVSTADAQTSKNWVIEEARIRGGYNNTAAGYGAKAYLVEDEPKASIRFNSLIYSGIFNSTTGVNNTNEFSVGEDITRSLDPANGSIQKLYAEDTNLIIFQENKVSNALIDKDAVYTAEGAGLTTTGKVVIGPVRAYAGNFGISRNPESFAVYGYRKYFTDKDRNAVLRLSQDGITEISNYGMIDFFRDQFSALDSYQLGPGKAVGMWDIYNKQYVVSLQPTNTDSYKTLAFDESVKGWTSFFSYKPALGTSLKNLFYTVDNGTKANKNAGLYLHYSQNVNRAQFYGTTYDASIKFIFNPNVSMSKVFKTINYEGSNGWEVDSYVSDFTGSKITGNGTSDGVVPFCKIYDSTILATNQGSVRRGAASVNINIDHADFEEWLEIREPKGDVNRQSLNLHQCAVVGDKFMRRLESGDQEARRKWSKLLQKRKATGEPYILFKGNTNKNNPEAYKKNSLKVHMTNICSEIVLHTDESHSFVCCLSSVNLDKYDEWKNTNLIYDATWFLDGVLEEFIQKAKNMKGFENSVRSAEKGRALGLGVLGWHSLLQKNGIAFEGLLAQFKTREIFSKIKIETERASRKLAEVYGEPLWCVGTGFRNTHLRAIAPTVSNSKLSGNVSPGIEPWAANVFTEQSAKGTFIRKNKELRKVLRKIGIDNKETWDKILADGGSVQGIKQLDGWYYDNGGRLNKDEGEPVKNVFKTFKEINQLELVRQAGIRQDYVDQSVSLNLAFPSEAPPRWLNQVHVEAWKRGIKTLYYTRTESVLRGDIAAAAMDPDCLSCDG